MHNKHCRLCGNQNNEMFDVFSETGSNKQLESKIKEIVRLNILPDDSLPKTVCVSCTNHLENASHFIDQCHQTQTYLSQLYEEIILPTSTQNSFRAPNHAEKIRVVLNDRADIEINITKLRSILSCKLEPDQTDLDNDSIENNSSQIISAQPYDNDTHQNTTEVPENSNAVKDDTNSNPSTSNSEPVGNTSDKKNAIPVEKISDGNLDHVPSNDTCSSTNDSQETIPLANTQNTTSNRSRLKRKCTMRTTPINDHLDSSDEENREPDANSDYGDDLNDTTNGKKPKLQTKLRSFLCKLCTSSFKDKKNLDEHLKTAHARKTFKCPICSHIAKNQKGITQHIKRAHNKPFACAICGYRIGEKILIRQHIESQHTPASWTLKKNAEENNNKDFFCATCNKTFSHELTYQEHLNIHSGKHPFLCKLRTASFRGRLALNQHLRTVHSDEQSKRPTCDYVAKHKGKLTEHMKCVHDKPFTCAICGYKSVEKLRIRQHITNQHTPASWTLKKNTKKNDKRFFCAICKETFSQELIYQEHLNVHSGKRPFSCKLCTASFRDRLALNKHLRTIHSDERFKCPTCDYVAKYKGKLTAHIMAVHDKPFTCDTCGHRTGEKDKLQHHIASKHSSTMSFVCEVCGKAFGTNRSLKIHMRNIHFPEPRVCQICGTVCPSYSKYNTHIFKCGKEKQKYECEKCGQKYAKKCSLQDHMNKHLNRKPYKCKVCGKAFYMKIRLNTHEYVHRGANFQCEICDRSFKRKDNMKSHMKRQHSTK
ncbi:zinc finger protein 37-like [Planococcus citri]|uniref:zinc finger protein 37-like n=1 Tax=Planococcus citri TaxID=170843 RepID=UPI0031F97A25